MKSKYQTEFKTSVYIRKKSQRYRKSHRDYYKSLSKKYYEEHKAWRKSENSRCQKIRIRRYKIDAIKKIADYHNSALKCWKCSENRLWCLTIGHIHKNGKEDRLKNGVGTKGYKNIIEGIRTCEDLRVECWNCNCVSYHFDKYPCELRGN